MIESVSNRIYFDSNVFIYAVEGRLDIAAPLRDLFDCLRARFYIAITSELTLAEVLAKADAAERFHYSSLIGSSGMFQLCPVSRDILIETASYRQMAGMPKLADAIHVVTAVRHGCQKILSGDLRLRVPDGISLIDTNPHSLSSLIQDLL